MTSAIAAYTQNKVEISQPENGVFSLLSSSVKKAWKRSQTRSQLTRLDDHLLEDIGMTRHDISRIGKS